MLTNSERLFPLGVQFTLPGKEDDKEFHRKLAHLQKLGFYGVELNVVEVNAIPAGRLKAILDCYDLKLTRVATGGMANSRGLSLSHADPVQRLKAQDGLRELMDYAAVFDAELILGFIKGAAGSVKAEAQKRLTESLAQVQRDALDHRTKLILEATNRYEASAVHSLADAASVVDQLDRRAFGILPDTFHMNIEERDMAAALIQYRDYYTAVHISDNNRYFPGLGAIDFAHVVNILRSTGFNGYLGIEGNLFRSFEEDISLSTSLMDEIYSRQRIIYGR